MMQPNVDLPWWAWGLIASLLLAQGLWLFQDARRQGANPWLWGMLGLIQFPVPTLVYLIAVRRILHRR